MSYIYTHLLVSLIKVEGLFVSYIIVSILDIVNSKTLVWRYIYLKPSLDEMNQFSFSRVEHLCVGVYSYVRTFICNISINYYLRRYSKVVIKILLLYSDFHKGGTFFYAYITINNIL